MPGMNRTGPMGQGPMTGRALGRCGQGRAAQPPDPAPAGYGYGNGYGYGRGFGRGFRARNYGRGQGRGFGPGYGRGYGRGFAARGAFPEDRQSLEERLRQLEDEARLIREQLETGK